MRVGSAACWYVELTATLRLVKACETRAVAIDVAEDD